MDRRKRTARTVALMSLFSMTDTQENVPVASFYGDGSDLISLIVGIDPVQAGSGDPSPDNVRPISGWTECKVTRTGINVWDGVTESGYININTGEELSSESQRRSLFVSCKPSTNYVYVNTNAASGVRIAFYDGAKNYAGMFSNNNSNPQSFTTPQNAKYLRFYWGDTSGISINYPSTATAYEEYRGTTYPIPLGQTVYGGTLDVTKGKLTVDKVAVTIDGNNIKFNQIAQYGTLNRFGFAYPSGLSGKYSGKTTYCIADKLTPSFNNTIGINQDSPEGYYCFPHSSAFFVSMSSSTITSIAEANAWAVDNTPKVVYELATPQTYNLTPTEITTLLGTNNICADTGDIKYIEYNI